jgi:hypothetical protein
MRSLTAQVSAVQSRVLQCVACRGVSQIPVTYVHAGGGMVVLYAGL